MSQLKLFHIVIIKTQTQADSNQVVAFEYVTRRI